jgi:hypothetical protein
MLVDPAFNAQLSLKVAQFQSVVEMTYSQVPFDCGAAIFSLEFVHTRVFYTLLTSFQAPLHVSENIL